ncbi:Ribonuclease P protein subunit p30 (RNaseP protein p30) (RNase P subunit 2) [Durusdinium trenchii]|uniref:Ribonuclease P protein subunit p30 (RNaseP protein p30) (RNase P subunit 2) n=1 Tax=Durusdinium trenchii TaxID=1381693 RepID=A0ABP0HXX0_9DINO
MAEPREAVGEAALKLLKEPQVKVLSQLQVLKIFNAGLNQLPETLWNCKELRQLDIGANPLAGALPAAGLAAHLTSLEILFAAKIGLKELPNLADCPKLRMLGVKDNQLSSLDGSLLPDTLEWLIAASNQISALQNMARLKRVRKLMLSHNQLTCATLAPVAAIEALEMLRVAQNRLEAFPEALLKHKRLAWVALGANPMAEEALERHLAGGFQSLDFKEVKLGEKLGSGAGATVYQGDWHGRTVAVKIWEAETFSDGTALSEWAANRVASVPGHPALVEVLGTFEEPRGMILELLPKAQAAAAPPSFATVTRDALPQHGGKGTCYTPSAARQIAVRVSGAAEYLHRKGLMHGDIYLHNTLVILTDSTSSPSADGLEVRSFGWLLQDLLECHVPPGTEEERRTIELLKVWRERCGAEDPEQLPSFQEIHAALSTTGAKKTRREAREPVGPRRPQKVVGYGCPVVLPSVSSASAVQGPLWKSLADDLCLPEKPSGLLLLRRLTLVCSDMGQVAMGSKAAALRPIYHLVALRPTSEEAFRMACEKGVCDILSLELDDKLPFQLRGKDLLAFTSRGGLIEIELGPALRDAGRRRAMLTNVEFVLHATRGRHVIMSSAALDPMEMRSPHDLANFASVMGVKGGLCCVSEAPYRALQRNVLRRHGPCQVLPGPPDVEMDVADAEEKTPGIKVAEKCEEGLDRRGAESVWESRFLRRLALQYFGWWVAIAGVPAVFLDHHRRASSARAQMQCVGGFEYAAEATGSRLRVETGPDRKDIKVRRHGAGDAGDGRGAQRMANRWGDGSTGSLVMGEPELVGRNWMEGCGAGGCG